MLKYQIIVTDFLEVFLEKWKLDFCSFTFCFWVVVVVVVVVFDSAWVIIEIKDWAESN